MISMIIIVTIKISINLKKDEGLNLVNVVHAIANHSREAGFSETFSAMKFFAAKTFFLSCMLVRVLSARVFWQPTNSRGIDLKTCSLTVGVLYHHLS